MVSTSLFCAACGAANAVGTDECFACGKSLAATQTNFQRTMLKQRYLVLGQIGQGGFGAVYKAADVQFGDRLLAIKEMSQSGSGEEDGQEVKQFKREAMLLAGLMHPNLPRIYDSFTEGGRWYLVMDFIEGEMLEDYLGHSSGGRLPLTEVLAIGLQLCKVLDYLHTRQPPIIFRDLKPSNVMRTSDGQLYLIDFGIARHFKPGQAKDTIAFGSPGYAAPEQYGKAQTTARSDIYSLGATLHHMLTGIDPSQTPFQFAPLQQQGRPIPPSLESLIMHMLEMNESKRPNNMITIKQQLQSTDARHPIGQINASQVRVSTQPGASPSNPPPPTQTRSAGVIQHPVVPKKAGSIYLNTKRYQKALLAFEQAIQLDPNDAVLYNGKGLALSNLNRYGEALLAYEQAIRLNPNNADAYFNKGNILDELKRYEEALAAYELAIRRDPNNADAHNNKGYTLSKLGRYEEALTAC